jgi:thiosulfate dehydrogenase (quinone) large subunit
MARDSNCGIDTAATAVKEFTMATTQHHDSKPVVSQRNPNVDVTTATGDNAAGTAYRTALGALRLALGWTFLWAFLDKAFALGFATGRNPETGVVSRFGDAAWINGGSPTKGFLSFGTKGPLADFYQSFAGSAWADWLFMIGLLGIGAALMLGIGMRVATISGALLLVLMWSAALWPANNPFMDDHIIYAIALGVLFFANAGRYLGFGRAWESTELVKRNPVLR